MYLSSILITFANFQWDICGKVRVPTLKVFANLSPSICPCSCVYWRIVCVVPEWLLGPLPNRPSHSPSPKMERWQEGKWESRAYIFLKQCCRWRPWGLLCLFHDQHKQRTTETRALDTCGHTQQPHTQSNTKLQHENKSGVWMPLWGREHWCDKRFWKSPSAFFFFFFFATVTFFPLYACHHLDQKKYGSLFFFFFTQLFTQWQ